MMELSHSEVPLYGQITVFAKFGEDLHLPEDAEFYFIYNGSIQRHVMFAERLNANSLRSIFPGHNCPEGVTVTVCMYTHGYSPVIVACSSITYVKDMPCNIAHFLKSHCDKLTPVSHETILSHFGLTVKDLQLLDRNIMLCVAHEELTPSWNILGSYAEKEGFCHETLLHLSMRWGLMQLSHFLMYQPGGSEALRTVNGEGDTPLDLAARNGHTQLVEILRNFQDTPPLDFCTAPIKVHSFLRFCHSSGVVTLTFLQAAGHSLESDLELFRKCLWDTHFLKKTISLIQDRVPRNQMQFHEASAKQEKRNSSIDVLKKLKSPPTFLAAARLSAMLNGSDEVYANCMVVDEVNDSDISYIHMDNASTDISHTDQSSPTPESSTVCESPDCSREGGNSENGGTDVSSFSSSSKSSSGVEHRQCRTLGYSADRSSAYAIFKKRSSSLDGLDADSEGEGTYVRYGSAANQESSGRQANSGDELESLESNADQDFPIRSAGTLPLSQGKDPLAGGVRLRSYSCSSPKLLLGKARVTRELSVGDPNDEQRAYSLPEQSREKRIEEEEWDKYMNPTKPESEKYKVSRTFSFFRNRMSSTRNKNKNKTKDSKEKEKEKEKVNKHHFVPGTFSGVVPCLVCEKALMGKESLQCSNCNVNVHKCCKDSTPACTKKFQERYHTKNKQPAVISNSSFKEIPQPAPCSVSPTSSLPLGFCSSKKDANQPVHPLSNFDRSDQSVESDGDTNGWRSRSQSEELLQTIGTPPSMDSFPIEDVVDSPLWSDWSDFSNDTLEFEAESWSLVVDSSFCNKQEKGVIKRQDVIFELIQTELHHIQTLLIMSEIFRKGMKEELQLDHSTVDKIFPCLDELLEIHRPFFYSMKERKQESIEGNERNFIINRIGDILVQQFSSDNANKMKQIYGEFCSHHIEAVNMFKELQQNKKFQNFIKERNSNLLARRRGIPECILLVTQRITKYPVLVERILQYTAEGTEEHKDLCKALALIKDVIAAVDLRVSEFEKEQKLLEILNKIENKTYTRMKNGHEFRKQDMKSKGRALLHEGLVFWKTATGRFKDIQALLLTDVLLFLQEKDQKCIFAAVDQKPPVICLQKLIVREVANEERGMFLISASSAGPEMYEIHTSTKEERNTWMRQIQEAVQSCPEEDEGKTSESDEDKRVAEAKAAKALKCQEDLTVHDQQLCNYLEEKLQIYAELAALSGGHSVNAEPQLLIKADSGEIPQATTLLTAALKEAENLYTILTSQTENISWLSEDYGNSSTPKRCLAANAFDEAAELSCDSLAIEDKATRLNNCDADLNISRIANEVDVSYTEYKSEPVHFHSNNQAEVLQAIQNLTRLLYSIQATVAMQDSQIEFHKVLLQEHELGIKNLCTRGNLLLEQEKYRNLEKHRGDLVNLHKLQNQFHQEQQRWSRECDQKHREYDEKESVLHRREEECAVHESRLLERRGELHQQLQEFQQNLDRLKEGQRLVEKEREELCVQLPENWKHTRQSSLPGICSHSKVQGGRNAQSDSLQCGESAYINNALAQITLNNFTSTPNPSYLFGHISNSSNVAHTTENNAMDNSNEPWNSLVSRQRLESYSAISRHSNKDACNNDLNAAHVLYCGTILASSSGGHHLNTDGPFLQQSIETVNSPSTDPSQSAHNGTIEENIVYI
ncbi:rho guanine nucleotide exchange factor 28 isoform X2 [Bombina bombina]|uniref:rho guanine nucleotide exchange factor 28 isoform X2 n=1 Tax=Bombina bombina TaxID=8345 RepID=UPI00235B0B66|nr:rho guanine nucleotide exchange factor 28 isoform X2 [Bombina bombina]